MADEQLKKKIYDVLKTGYFSGPDDAVDVSAVRHCQPQILWQTSKRKERLNLVSTDAALGGR